MTVQLCEYGTATCAAGRLLQLNVSVAGLMTNVNVWLAVCGVDALSITDIVNEKAPAVVGVPEMTPLVALNVNPPGSAPELIE